MQAEWRKRAKAEAAQPRTPEQEAALEDAHSGVQTAVRKLDTLQQ